MAISVKAAGGGGLSSSDVTASSAQVLAGYTALTTDSNDEAKQGTIVTKTASDLTVSGATVTAPAGYYATSVSKSVATTSRTAGSGSASFGTPSNVTLSDTNNGIAIPIKGSGSVSTGSGYVTEGSTTSNEGSATKYVTAVTVPTDKTFTVTTTADTSLDTSSDLDVTNNAYRRVDITNNGNATTIVTNVGNAIVNAGSTAAGNLTVSAYNSSGTAENSKTVVSAGKWNATTVTPGASAQGPYYGRTSVNAVSTEHGSRTSNGTEYPTSGKYFEDFTVAIPTYNKEYTQT